MTRPMTREERKAAALGVMSGMVDELEAWYDAHPEASFEELEGEARRLRRRMMGSLLEVVINGRDSGQQAEAPVCEGCRSQMRFKGYRRRRIAGLEGESELARAYYVCPACEGQTLFPPGSETAAARG